MLALLDATAELGRPAPIGGGFASAGLGLSLSHEVEVDACPVSKMILDVQRFGFLESILDHLDQWLGRDT